MDGPTTDDPGLTKALLAAGDPDRADAQGSVPAGSAPDGRADRLRHTPARAELPKVLRAVARGKAAEGRLGRPGPQRTEPRRRWRCHGQEPGPVPNPCTCWWTARA